MRGFSMSFFWLNCLLILLNGQVSSMSGFTKTDLRKTLKASLSGVSASQPIELQHIYSPPSLS